MYMKKLLLCLACIAILVGCKEHDNEVSTVTGAYVNGWVYNLMSEVYYWNTSLPAKKTSDADPKEYFETLKNSNDRFSAIFENYEEISNELNGIMSADIGFDFRLFKENYVNNNVIGIVTYVKKGTSAEKAGIKRGFRFRKINNQQINTENYRTLINLFFDSSSSVNITFSSLQNTGYVDSTPVAVTKATNYQEDPVYLDSVYTVDNKKIGYLVYNFFTNDAGDNSKKYDLELNNVFGRFKSKGISELVIDLRYNGGGAVSSAINLASMMVPNLTSNKLFLKTQYNSKVTEDLKKQYPTENVFEDDFATTINGTPVQNVGNSLQRIFVLTSQQTASASEMVINGLKPFIPVILVGDTTVGKNMASYLFSDESNKENKWAIMPLILKYANAQGKSDFDNGFAPDYYVFDYINTQLGDINEGLLAAALSKISGINQVARRSAEVVMTPFKSSADFKRFGNGVLYKEQKIRGALSR